MNQRQDGPGRYHVQGGLPPMFADRADAGTQLAYALREYRGQHALVLALPRGGVPVASEIAHRIGADLDVLVARKLGAPGQEELAIGAVTADGTRYLNEELIQQLAVTPVYLDRITQEQREVARSRGLQLRKGLPALDVEGRVVIVVDDGLATGATMHVAIWALRRANPLKLVVAVPVGAADSCATIATEVDDFVCLHQPDPFYAVGMYYRDFGQTSDEEAAALLEQHRKPGKHGPLLGYTGRHHE